jgi:WD40 repeat protein
MLSRTLSLLAVLVLPVLARAESASLLGDSAFRVGEYFDQATLSPDGKVFAVRGRNGRFYLLDVDTGKVVRAWQHDGDVQGVGFDSAGRVMTVDWHHWVRTFDPVTGRQVREVLLDGHRPHVATDGIFQAGGRYLLRRGFQAWDPDEALYDTTTGQEVGISSHPRFRLSDPGFLFSPDGRLLFLRIGRAREEQSTGFDPLKGEIPTESSIIFNPETGFHTPGPPLPRSWDHLQTFTPQGQLLVDRDLRDIVIADPHTGRIRKLPLEGIGDQGYIRKSAVSANGARVAVLFGTRGLSRVVEWDFATGRQLGSWPLPEEGMQHLAYTPEGRLLAWNEHGRRLRVVRLHEPPTLPGPGHSTRVAGLRFSPDSRLLESIDTEGQFLRWDLASGRILGEEYVPIMVHLPDDRRRLADILGFDATGERVLVQFDPPGWYNRRTEQVETIPLPPWDTPHYAAPNGRALYHEKGGSWLLYEPDTGQRRVLPPDAQSWLADAPGPIKLGGGAGRRFVTLLTQEHDTDSPLRVAVVDVAANRIVGKWLAIVPGKEPATELAPDGSVLAISSDRDTVLHEVPTGRIRARIALPSGYVWPLAFTPDSRAVLVICTRPVPELRLVEVATGTTRRAWPTLSFPEGPVLFSPDGRRIAYPQGDGTIRMLDADLPARPLDPATLWRDLGSPDAAIANVAVQALATRPGARKEIAARRLFEEPAPPETVDLLPLLAALEHDDPAIREAAQRNLRSVPAAALEALEGSLVRPSPQLRRALRDVIDQQDDIPRPAPGELRRLRVTEVLDRLAPQRE